jgi:hypothetical protein
MATTISGVIAVFLLGLYVYAIFLLVRSPGQEPGPQVGVILNLVGGLISALVVAILASTPPTTSVAARFAVSEQVSGPVTVVVWGYLFVWLACGGVLLFFWLRTPDPAKTLASAATSWLGLAVAAAYAYLGLEKS